MYKKYPKTITLSLIPLLLYIFHPELIVNRMKIFFSKLLEGSVVHDPKYDEAE